MGRYSRALHRALTEDEMNKNTSGAIATIGGWQYNNCDICINPHEKKIEVGEMYVEISTAQGDSGRWQFNKFYNFGSCGGCGGVLYPTKREGYDTEGEAIEAGCKQVLGRARERILELKRWAGNPELEKKGELAMLLRLADKLEELAMPSLF